MYLVELCFKFLEKVLLEEGVMCEFLSVGVYICCCVNIGFEICVLIIGGGVIGLVILFVVRVFGSFWIIVVDIYVE